MPILLFNMFRNIYLFLKQKIAKLATEAELQNKHIEWKKIKKELRSISVNLRTTFVSFTLCW